MNILQRLTVKQKMMLPGVIVLIGFAAILLLYNYDLRMAREADEKYERIASFDEYGDKLYIQMLQARRREKDFLLRGDTAYIGKFEQAEEEAGLLLEKIEKLAPSEELLIEVKKTKEQWNLYKDGFKRMSEVKIAMGLNESEGLLGELRRVAHEVEDDLGKTDPALLNSLLMIRRHEKDFLARKDDKYVMRMAEEQARFAALTKKSSLPSSIKRELAGRMKRYDNSFLALVEGYKEMDREIASFRDTVHAMESEIGKFLVEGHRYMERERQLHDDSIQAVTRLFYILLAVIAVLVLAPIIWLARDVSSLVASVYSSGSQVAASVSMISASSKEQEATATEKNATSSEVAASVKEIAATTKDLGKTMEDVNRLSQDTAELAVNGRTLLEGMDANMNRMSEASGTISDKLSVLSEKTGNISNMVTTINKVAEQTNLLSLNAAIEAEKAGEYGLGFSVVATEIRRLADQTAVATYDIEQMVNEVQSAVSAGVMSMDKFSEEIHSSVENEKEVNRKLEKIIEQVQTLAPHIESICDGLRAQAEGTEQINEAIVDLSEADQQSIISIRQVNSALADLNDTAHSLKEGIKSFRVNKEAA